MDFILALLLILGLILYLVGQIIVSAAAFKHHTMTGLISLIPVVNIIILPTVWHKADKGFYLGIIGLLLAAGTWYAGADKHLAKLANNFGMNVDEKALNNVTEGLPVHRPSDIKLSNEEEASELPDVSNEIYKAETPLSPMEDLPSRPLYKMEFKQIGSDEWAHVKGQLIKIYEKDKKVYEGKALNANNRGITIERITNAGTISFTIKRSDIAMVEKLTKTRLEQE